jgi:hypothetical protein
LITPHLRYALTRDLGWVLQAARQRDAAFKIFGQFERNLTDPAPRARMASTVRHNLADDDVTTPSSPAIAIPMLSIEGRSSARIGVLPNTSIRND